MVIASVGGTVLGLIMMVIPVLLDKKTSRSMLYMGLAILIFSLCMFGASREPERLLDLYRHYRLIDRVRNHDWNTLYAIFKGIPRMNSNYDSCYLYNLIIVLIAKFLPNQSLVVLAVLLFYGVFAYIFAREYKGKKLDSLSMLTAVMMCSAAMPYLYIYSGIRNSSAAALAALGVYRYFKVDHNLIGAVIWIGMGVLIHPFAAVAVIALVLYRFRPNPIWFVCIVLFPLLLDPLMDWFRFSSGIEFLRRIGAKYYNYIHVREDHQGYVFYFTAILIPLIWCLMILLRYKKPRRSKQMAKLRELLDKLHLSGIFGEQNQKEEYDDVNLLSGLWWYTILSLGFMRAELIMLRFPYFLGCFAPFFVRFFLGSAFSTNRYRLPQFVSLAAITMLAVFILYENMAWLPL